ncbi:MAG: hypothetical protein R2729_02120 [Bryobacteraceae bacterium]
MNHGSEFFIGYEANAPPGIARWIRRCTLFAAGLGVTIAVALVTAQGRFDPASFAFQDFRGYQGALATWPAPILHRPDISLILTGPGKHGLAAGSLQSGPVKLSGALAANGPNRLLEALPGSISAAHGESAPEPERYGTRTLRGEIVDTKCYVGVMNPGRGKVHRACAARCLSGGIPAGLLVRDQSGEARVFVLAGSGAAATNTMRLAGEAVRVTGSVMRQGSVWILEVDSAAIRRE